MVDASLIFNVTARDQATPVLQKMSGAAMAAGAAIGIALAVGLAGALEKSKSDAMLVAQLGLQNAPEMAKEFGAISGRMYANGFGETAADVNKALKEVWQNGLVDEDAAAADIEKVTGMLMSIGTIMEEDTARVSAAVSQMLRTGMAKSAEEAMDIIVRSTQQGINKSEDLLDTFNEYGTQFRQIGLDGTTAMGLISQSLKAGARDADTAADALKEFAIRGQNGSKASADAYKALGIDAKKAFKAVAEGGPGAASVLGQVLDKLRAMPAGAEKTALAVALFGTKSEDLQLALNAMDMSTAADQLGKVEGAAQAATNTLGASAGAKLESFKRKAQAALVDTMAKAVPYIEDVVGWMTKHEAVMRPLVAVLAAFAVVIGVIVAITKVYTIVQAALNVVMMLNPFGLIVLAIIALVAGFAILYAKVSWFRDGVDAVFHFIIAAAQLWWSVFSTFWLAVGGFFVGLFQKWWALFSGFWTGVFNLAVGFQTGLINVFLKIVGFVTSLPGRISSAASGMWDGIKNAFRSAINWIIGRWNGLAFRIPSISIPGFGQVFGGMNLNLPDIPYLAKGGNIQSDGLAMVHAGERVVPAAQVTPLNNTSGRPQAVQIDLRGEREIVALVRRLMRTANLLQGG